MAQLEKIGTAMEQRWGSEREDRNKKSRNDKEGSEDGLGESQKEGTPLSASC